MGETCTGAGDYALVQHWSIYVEASIAAPARILSWGVLRSGGSVHDEWLFLEHQPSAWFLRGEPQRHGCFEEEHLGWGRGGEQGYYFWGSHCIHMASAHELSEPNPCTENKGFLQCRCTQEVVSSSSWALHGQWYCAHFCHHHSWGALWEALVVCSETGTGCHCLCHWQVCEICNWPLWSNSRKASSCGFFCYYQLVKTPIPRSWFWVGTSCSHEPSQLTWSGSGSLHLVWQRQEKCHCDPGTSHFLSYGQIWSGIEQGSCQLTDKLQQKNHPILSFYLSNFKKGSLNSSVAHLLSLSSIVDDFLFQGPLSVGFRVWIELVLLALKKQHKASLTHL